MPSLIQIKNQVEYLAEKIKAPKSLLPTFGYSIDMGKPYVEVDKLGQLYYSVMERGEILKREVARDLDDLFYKIFSGVTFEMAVEFELKNRKNGQDFRRQIYSKQEELLDMLSNEWKQRICVHHKDVLRSNPFDDNVLLRTNYVLYLKDIGLPYEKAVEEAYKKYPLPA